MSDSIDRQVVLKGISLSCTGQSDVIKAEAALVRYVKKIPSTETEIIRCKDCLIHGVCRFEQWLGLDGYCSQAERRTDE